MIDLVSTSTDDVQTQRCAHLLAAVIAHAIVDAGSPMSLKEKEQHKAIGEPLVAIKWLFDKGTTFDLYCQLIGANAETVRNALLGYHEIPKVGSGEFTEINRRNLQARYRWTFGG